MQNTINLWMSPQGLYKEFGISTSTQNKLRMKKAIPFSKIGNKIFYHREKIDQWLKDAEVS